MPRLLKGLRIDARSVLRITGMPCDEVIGDEDQIESLELGWLERADTLGSCALCGCGVNFSGNCMRCQIVRLPEVPEPSEAQVEVWEKRRGQWLRAMMEDSEDDDGVSSLSSFALSEAG